VKYKAGDTVRIRSKEWIDAQEKDEDGDIRLPDSYFFSTMMQEYCGRIAKVVRAVEDRYELDIDETAHFWSEHAFDPSYTPDELLSAEDAIRAMLDGETLYNEKGHEYRWVKDHAHFIKSTDHEFSEGAVYYFDDLHRHSAKRERPMTRWEILAWVNSEASRGWFARIKKTNGSWGNWKYPMTFDYTCTGETDFNYQRARLLPDLSGIDESTIQGFEVEE
jgi:hypothetical protein